MESKSNLIKFYKGVLVDDLCENFIPGTVTKDINEALLWKERAESRKCKGIHRHVRKGKAAVISIDLDADRLLDHAEFQRPGVSEHQRKSCWTSADKTKAQINHPVKYRVIEIH